MGFGINTPEAATAIAGVADAVVVGSAIVNRVATAIEQNSNIIQSVTDFVEILAKAVHSR